MSDKWHLRFLEMAKMVSTYSKDPSTKVGAVIVDTKHRVRGIGFNGFARGVQDLPDRYENRKLKYKLIVHAEQNAILNSFGNLEDCILYVWPTLMIPNCCPECAKIISQVGIKTVVGYSQDNLTERWQDLAKISSIILKESGIEYISV